MNTLSTRAILTELFSLEIDRVETVLVQHDINHPRKSGLFGRKAPPESASYLNALKSIHDCLLSDKPIAHQQLQILDARKNDFTTRILPRLGGQEGQFQPKI